MEIQTAKPVGKKAAKAISSKPKISKAAATIAKSPVAKKPAVKKVAAKKPAAKNPLAKVAAKSPKKMTKPATVLPKKSATPAAKKAAAPVPEKITSAKKIPEKKTPAKKATATKSKPAVNLKPVNKPSPEERYRMVEVAAYFIAEQHGFQGRTDEYWAAAEQQIAARLGP